MYVVCRTNFPVGTNVPTPRKSVVLMLPTALLVFSPVNATYAPSSVLANNPAVPAVPLPRKAVGPLVPLMGMVWTAVWFGVFVFSSTIENVVLFEAALSAE